jgi:hypothetical protein
MRGAEADGIDGMILHPINEAPPPRDQCDAQLSAAYGQQRFFARARSGHIKTLEEQWLKFVNEIRTVPDNPLTGDMRSVPATEGRWVPGKARARRKKALAVNRNFGEGRDCQIMTFPGFAGHRPRLLGGFCVSGARKLRVAATRIESLTGEPV